MTYLCVAIFVHDEAQAKRDIAMAGEAGADLVELRVDQVTDVGMVRRVLAASSAPCILTMRAHWEGGRCTLNDDDRLQMLFDMVENAADEGPAYIDLELAAVKKLPNTLTSLKQIER